MPTPKGLITLTINNQVYSLKVAPEWTLYDLIHDKLGLIGAKQFCDRGACGSCTVIMEGRVILSCMTLAIECDAKEIETVEGISEAEHPLIESYAKHHAMQCGYCTPGFVVSAKALLDKNPDPTEDEIKDALAGNLCRCGTYPQHPIAIKEAAQEKKKYPHGKKQAMTPRDDAQKMSIATRAVEALETLKEGEQDGQ
ncbi:MAG: (2Fe-2S)-binding protein [Desulfobacterales bacterium]|nr:(2Fe-2S)-binding protein [Desulfobacterales bacterium]